MLILTFFVVLLVGFGIVVYLTRPTATETAVRRTLDRISAERASEPVDTTILKDEKLSPAPWVHDLLAQIPLSWKLLNLIKQAGSKWFVSSTFFYSATAAFAAALIMTVAGSDQGRILLVTAMAGASPLSYLFILRHQKLTACNTLLPQAVELLSRALRAGLALNSAIEIAGRDIPEPLGSEFRIAHEQQSLGLPFRDAMLNLLDRLPLADMRFLITALLLQRETGGNLVQILETVVTVMRERIRIRGQIRIYTAQARVTAWVVALMPAFMYLALNTMNPGYSDLLLDDPSGRRVFYFGCIMWAVGILLIKKIVTIKV